MAVKYDAESRAKRAVERAARLASLMDIRNNRVLEIGAHMGDVSVVLARDYGCEVVGIDPMPHENWPQVMADNPRVTFIEGDMANPPPSLADNSFDLIVSFVVFEHIRHPWSALQNCQRLLKPSGKHFINANLYRSAVASHLYNAISEPWPHLMYSPDEIRTKFKRELGWAFWVNKLTYQQYLYYFRRLGWHITYEKFEQGRGSAEYMAEHEDRLGLYPEWDLKTDFFSVLLEFDPAHPKQPIPDPVYRLRAPGT